MICAARGAIFFGSLMRILTRVLIVLAISIVQPYAHAEMPSKATLLEDGGAKSSQGTVRWEAFSRKRGTETEICAKGEAYFPVRDVKMAVVICEPPPDLKPISYTMDIYLRPADFSGSKGVREVQGALVRPDEVQFSTPFSARTVKMDDAHFGVGLIDKPSRAGYSLQLLNENDWIAVAIGFNDKTTGLIDLQKGETGDAAFADAEAAWGKTKVPNLISELKIVRQTPKYAAMQAVRNQVMACWPTPKLDSYPKVSISAHYNMDGTLYGEPDIVRVPGEPAALEAEAVALAAVKECQPIRMGRKVRFEDWRTTEIVFGGRP